MKSGDEIRTVAGTMATLPYANEHPCFGRRQGWCNNLATYRLEGEHVILHFCEECKQRPEFDNPWSRWKKLEDRSRGN